MPASLMDGHFFVIMKNDSHGEARRMVAAFTLMELLVVMTILAVLAGVGFGGWNYYRGLATSAVCSSNLRQLSAAVGMYCSDNLGFFPPYVTDGENGRKNWFFGSESGGGSEGERDLDREAGPLYPYIREVGSIEVCPGFDYGNAVWKPKFKGASYGYGYNWHLGGQLNGKPMNMARLSGGSRVIVFGDCGQVNTFQAPASRKNPMIEEFYLINETDKTIHFRHAKKANILFVDGHVEAFKPCQGTEDERIPGEIVGRITPRGSMEYLK
jgi:prepilin-type processing-associated H-X9-DG protein/prepilin-type N-terminal cleavage/methylation domain-containing protein